MPTMHIREFERWVSFMTKWSIPTLKWESCQLSADISISLEGRISNQAQCLGFEMGYMIHPLSAPIVLKVPGTNAGLGRFCS